MMRVRVRYFASFREATGIDDEWVDTDAKNLRALFDEAMARHAGLDHEPAALVAVNDCMADWDARVGEGDEVLFFPPVAGG
ncbi:MAG: molybdopterin synthase sulfur carrier subunit [Xanthomonadales bacterium]|nr:molybdopterin synthase sulfur carrier subunit [Xanthomonadales bacterium]NIN59432.1 molybdopterin synthase sulfur carrier subunit [Xanthomonadales bacterium]NIN74783.1 molybdopterin synthase sulfur carrier subunit [Xanthomonadales bacterium]NIO14021.1 molybdopterin synthase sulfur carrier subunit [Xanthomonadales bacterium]NIP11825.1 molybdopterin synthase sulfur carrier subunit [Xanthomonadales bacterium]